MNQQQQQVVSKDMKKPYEKPELAELGTVEAMTQQVAQQGGSQLTVIFK